MYSDPFASGLASVRASRASGLKNAIMTIGMMMRLSIDAGSESRTRSSWRTRAAFRDGDIGALRFGGRRGRVGLEAAAGDGEVHGLEGRVHDLPPGERRVAGTRGGEGGG